MEQNVTYADLRFVKVPPAKSTQKREETSEEELTYENVWDPHLEAGKAPNSSVAPKGLKLLRPQAFLALVGLCLFLLASVMGLGVSYWKLSWKLQQVSQAHAENSSTLAQRIHANEEGLASCRSSLKEKTALLNATDLALGESKEAASQCQKEREEQEEKLGQIESRLARLEEEKREVEKNATSCQHIGCCPDGWTLFRWKCLKVSRYSKKWEESVEECSWQSAQLLTLKKPWSVEEIWAVRNLWDARSDPYSSSYWIGQKGDFWLDDLPQRYSALIKQHTSYKCGMMKHGYLTEEFCTHRLRFICEKPATPAALHETWSLL